MKKVNIFTVFVITLALLVSCNSKVGGKDNNNHSDTSRDLHSYHTYLDNYEIVYDKDGCIAISVIDSLGRSQTTFAKLDNVPGEYQRIKDKIISVYWGKKIESIISYHSGIILNSKRVTCYDDNLKFKYIEQPDTIDDNNIYMNHPHIILQVLSQTEKIVHDTYASIEGLENLKEVINRTHDLNEKEIVELDTITNPDIHRKIKFFIETSKKINTFYNKQITQEVNFKKTSENE
ncbi:MAG: hypothetical protein KBT34_08615 [Prevotella sp.]|nr:hypothetical protein [Candidatus Prevotella equi]